MMAQLIDEYKIKKGLSDKQISQLINYSSTDEGLKFTSDKTRFKDRQSFDEFSKEIMAYYTLADDEDNLLGIIWFQDLSIPVIARNDSDKAISEESGMTDEEYGITFAIRLYGEARGKGLALPFTEEVMSDFEESEEYKNHPNKKIWLSVSPENEAAVALYRKLGFKDLKIDESHNKLLMIKV